MFSLDISRSERTNTLPLISLQVTQFAVQSGRALLAGVAPTFADGSAAQLSRANYPL